MNSTAGHIPLEMFPLLLRARLTLVRHESLKNMAKKNLGIIFRSLLSALTVRILCLGPLSRVIFSSRSILFDSFRAPRLMNYLALPVLPTLTFVESKLALVSGLAGLEMMCVLRGTAGSGSGCPCPSFC